MYEYTHIFLGKLAWHKIFAGEKKGYEKNVYICISIYIYNAPALVFSGVIVHDDKNAFLFVVLFDRSEDPQRLFFHLRGHLRIHTYIHMHTYIHEHMHK